MDNEIEKRARISKKFFALAVASLAIVSVIVGAALSAHETKSDTNESNAVETELLQILDTKEVVSKKDVDYAEFSAKVDEISEALDKVEAELKDEQAKAKFEEAKKSFAEIKESGELAKIISQVSNGINSDTINKLKSNEKLKSIGESLEAYEAKVKAFKEKYSGKGDDMQAVFDYSELEKASEAVKAEVTKLQDGELSGVTSDEIDAFYDKIEELKEIISNNK